MKLNLKFQKAMAIMAVSAISFSAVPTFAHDYKGHWAEKAIATWFEKGIVAGYEDGTFKPNESVTRAELAAFVSRIFGLTDMSKAKAYGDVEEGKWYTDEVKKVTSAGIMNDYGLEFKPYQKATREEAAFAIATAYKITEGKNLDFKDKDQISNWAVDEIAALATGGYISGRPDGSFAPKDTLSRADIVMMIDKVTAELINKPALYTQNVEGNLVINSKDVILRNMTVKGNLYLAQGIGEGDVTLDNVKVTGKTFVEGGGSNSVKLKKSKLGTMIVSKVTGKVRVALDINSQVENLLAQSPAKLQGEFVKVQVATKEAIEFTNAQVKELAIQAKDAKVTLDKESTLTKLVVSETATNASLDNKGPAIKEAVLKADGFKSTGKGAQLITKGDNVKNSDMHQEPAHSGGGGGGGGGGSTTPSTPEEKDITFKDVVFSGLDGKDIMSIPALNQNKEIVVNFKDQKALTVNGHKVPSGTIGQMKLTSDTVTDKDNLKVYTGTGGVVTTVNFKANTNYTESDLVAIAKEEARVNGIAGTLKAAGLSEAEQKRAEEIISEGYRLLDEAAKAPGVQADNVIGMLKRIQNKFNDPDIIRAYQREGMETNLQNLLGVRVTYDNDKVQKVEINLNFVKGTKTLPVPVTITFN